MTRKINYTYTFKLPENPGYLSDELWAKSLVQYLLLTMTHYEPEQDTDVMFAMHLLSDSGYSEVAEALDYALAELSEQYNVQLLNHAEYPPNSYCDVNAMLIGPWVKLFITLWTEDI